MESSTQIVLTSGLVSKGKKSSFFSLSLGWLVLSSLGLLVEHAVSVRVISRVGNRERIFIKDSVKWGVNRWGGYEISGMGQPVTDFDF